MITAGIDVGLKNIKAVIVKDGEIAAYGIASSEGFNREQAADKLWDQVLKDAGVAASDVQSVIATGTGKMDVSFATNNVVESVADLEGAKTLCPSARTFIDVGAEQVRVVKYDENGKTVCYTLNQMCGAGLGLLAESVARQLDVSLDEMSDLAMASGGIDPINAECGNYALLDVITLFNTGTPEADIARAVADAIAIKIQATANLTDIDKDNIVLLGGVANNRGVVASLDRLMGTQCLIPEQPEMAGAYGAAMIGAGEA